MSRIGSVGGGGGGGGDGNRREATDWTGSDRSRDPSLMTKPNDDL